MAALSHYYKLEPNHAQKKTFAKFVDPPRKVDAVPLAQVTIALAATLWNLRNLLDTLGEQDLAKKLDNSVATLIKDNRKTLRSRFSALKDFFLKTAVTV